MPESTNTKSAYSKELWENMFVRYFQDEIYKLAKSFPLNRYLIILYTFLEDGWSDDAVKFFINYPEIALKDANDTLHTLTLPIKFPDEMKERWYSESGIKISGYPAIPIENLRSRHFNTFVSVTGTIIERSNIHHIASVVAYECPRCNSVTNVPQDITGEPEKEPDECESDLCGRKGSFKMIQNESEWADVRKIRIIGEFPAGLDAADYELDAILVGDVDCPQTGERITASGVLKNIQIINKKVKTVDFSKLLEINNIEKMLDSEIISTGLSKSQWNRIRVLREIIRELQDELKEPAPLKDITEKALEAGMKEDDIKDILNKLKQACEIIEVANGKFRAVYN
uniref:DNA helicase n=1 Tax=viral metagenome TaxID=1070528 RepID=A0A6M3M914_9ZZZZ